MSDSRWFWLSFAGEEGNLGVVVIPVGEREINLIDILDGTDRIELLRERGQDDDVPFYTAVQLATFIGLNPGGEVQGWDVTPWIDEIAEDKRCKLLSKDDVEGLGGELMGEGEKKSYEPDPKPAPKPKKGGKKK